ncbi:MAG: hypothetical protein PHQ23_14685 [Candidatus Wallbacteria bacterium]|nr:hypothetical protein [Candidatus Wallbacteria bacterium]
MHKVICLVFALFIAVFLQAWDKPLHIDSDVHEMLARLKSVGVVGTVPDERELLAKGVHLHRLELAALYGKILLRRFNNRDTYKKYGLSRTDLSILDRLFTDLDDHLVSTYFLEMDQLRKCHENLLSQLKFARKDIDSGAFHLSQPLQTSLPETQSENAPPVDENSLEAIGMVQDTKLEQAVRSGLKNFYLIEYEASMIHFERARFYSLNESPNQHLDLILFWLIRLNLLRSDIELSEKYISAFVQHRFTPVLSGYSIEDTDRVFLELEDSLFRSDDSVWLHYWAGTLYLHNSSNQARASEHFKKVFELTNKL